MPPRASNPERRRREGVGRAEGERHGRTQQYLQLVDRLSGWGERGTGASKARELERMAGGWSEERGGGGKREKGLLYRGAPPRE